VLFLDRGLRHTAKGSQRLVREPGIDLRSLPIACLELNPAEAFGGT
jgi:hypothetical protein